MADGNTRELRAVADEPPFDADYDPPPPPDRGSPNGTPTRTTDRTPPHDATAEQAVLGAMLISQQAILDASTLIDPADHYRPAHETIHATILALHHRGDPVDPITVAAELARQRGTSRGQTMLDHVGGPVYLHTLTAELPTAANAAYYAKLVRDKARLRTAADVGTKLTHLAYTATVEQVDLYLGDALQVVEEAATRFSSRDPDAPSPSGLHDLSWVLKGEPPTSPPPVYVRRSDGVGLFYRGKVNGIFGDPEHGKTWVAQAAIVEALAAGERAAMIDVDHNGPDHTAARLLLLGARLEHLADPACFRYYEPNDGPELLQAAEDIYRWAPHVMLVDSLGEVFPLLGANQNHDNEVTNAMRQVCTRPATTGTCVITIDHLPKSTEARATGFAIGSMAKKRMMRGAYLRADARQKPMPGGVGRIMLRIEKDTTGELRRASGGGYAGTFTLDSTRDHITTWHCGVEAVPHNTDGTLRPTRVMAKVSAYIADHDGCSQRDIESDVGGRTKYVREAIRLLVQEGHVARTDGPRGSKQHHTISPYREEEDDRVPAEQLDPPDDNQ